MEVDMTVTRSEAGSGATVTSSLDILFLLFLIYISWLFLADKRPRYGKNVRFIHPNFVPSIALIELHHTVK